MGKQVLFLLSPRLLDLDTFIPSALALKGECPNWDIHFISFSPANADYIAQNKTLVKAMEQCGRFHNLGTANAGKASRLFRRISHFLNVAALLLKSSKPVMFLGTPYKGFPYSLWLLIAWLRGGKGHLLSKTRNTDDSIQIGARKRIMAMPQNTTSWIEAVFGRDFDAFIHYHDQQEISTYSMGRNGRIDDSRKLSIGLPNRLKSWTNLIDAETAAYRKELLKSGIDLSGEVYTFFPSKLFASLNMRTETSAGDTFTAVLEALKSEKPSATILIRLHPVSINDPFFSSEIKRVGLENALVTYAHPEVLGRLSKRIIVNGPTNIQTTMPDGNFIDCTDYSEEHLKTIGPVSLAEGYGTLYVSPREPGFTDRLVNALDDDSAYDAPGITKKRRNLNAANPPKLNKLVLLLKTGQLPRAA